METIATTKLCPDCGLTKPVGDFYGGDSKHRRTEWICKICSLARQRDRRKSNPERTKDFELKYKHGITLDDYNTVLKEQGSVCAICKKAPGTVSTGNNSKGTLAVDHCHVTGTFRGLLCTNCNLGIGSFFESTELLENAAVYLKEHQDLVARLLAEKAKTAIVQAELATALLDEIDKL